MNKSKLLKGSPISVQEILVYPLTLSEIVDEIGENEYNSLLAILNMNKETLVSSFNDGVFTPEEFNEINELSSLNLLIMLSSLDSNFQTTFINAIKVFLKVDNVEITQQGIVINVNKISKLIDSSIFDDIKFTIMNQNYLGDTKKDEFKPANPKAQMLLNKLNKAKEKIQKKNNEKGLELSDVISIVATYSNAINLINIWKLTVYQLYENYLRILVWDEYHNDITLLPHMEEQGKKAVYEKHWAKDIKKLI
ncbi:hypothetical protein [Cytobacillus horneckiae]|uniref:Uncharacterized protein n=1 Tax=Cytobacillus horneckiae TaxID=549687 RepID=A0A2N0ZFA7_9BACI|nr:hypothetical protein [Cytobacillus horneckiae]MEC1155635.1 hypothetical protein [Cytobacillus horneckiae]MED2936953.1 hypothetical protein [Cytobacillus horneckiae]PKG28189.1 hypothetical protein CWS20_15205 [Cytobacillus horneckiae]